MDWFHSHVVNVGVSLHFQAKAKETVFLIISILGILKDRSRVLGHFLAHQ